MDYGFPAACMIYETAGQDLLTLNDQTGYYNQSTGLYENKDLFSNHSIQKKYGLATTQPPHFSGLVYFGRFITFILI